MSLLAAVAAGKLNKQIAGDLGIVEQTVKFHRRSLSGRRQCAALKGADSAGDCTVARWSLMLAGGGLVPTISY